MNNKKAKSIRRVVRREVRRADVQSKRPRWMPKGLWERFVRRVSLAFKPQTKGEVMNHKGGVKIPIPNIGGGQTQAFDVREAVQRRCAACDGEYFDPVVRLGVISKVAPNNRTGQDVLVPMQCFLCRGCGGEFGKAVPVS